MTPTRLIVDSQSCDQPVVAALFRDSLREFYDLFSFDEVQVNAAISAQLPQSATELAEAWITETSELDIVGAYACYDVRELAARQSASLKLMFDYFEPTRERFGQIDAFRKGAQAIACHGLYLARIAVAPQARKRGLGAIMVEHFKQQAIARSADSLLLHVHADNQTAISFYKGLGFDFLASAEQHTHRAMRLAIQI